MYQIAYSGDIKLNTYVQMLIDNGVLVPVEGTVLHLPERSRIEAIPVGKDVGIVTWLESGDWQFFKTGDN